MFARLSGVPDMPVPYVRSTGHAIVGPTFRIVSNPGPRELSGVVDHLDGAKRLRPPTRRQTRCIDVQRTCGTTFEGSPRMRGGSFSNDVFPF